MLKLRIILTSALILLLVGLDMNVRAAVDAKKVNSKSTQKKDSEKDSKEQEPQEIITHLDFFSAFSLVNVQLQWRDLSSVLNNESTDAESTINSNALSLLAVVDLTLEGKSQLASSPSIVKSNLEVIPTSIFRVINGKTHVIYSRSAQIKRTIAYIQNCATYPHRA